MKSLSLVRRSFGPFVVLAAFSAIGAAGCSSGEPGASAAAATSGITEISESKKQTTGLENEFTVLSFVGEAESDAPRSSSFTRPVRLGASYKDLKNYYASNPQSVHVVMIMNLEQIHANSKEREKSTRTVEFDIARQQDGSYRGTKPSEERMPGSFGDSDTTLTGVDVAFVAEGDKWDSNLGKNYHVAL